jgi:rhodanese-related sulfurtransferase
MTARPLLLLAALVPVLLPGCGAPKTKDKYIAYIDLASLTEHMNEDAESPPHLVLVDPRPVEDYDAAHIPTAVSIRLPELEREDRRHPALAGHAWIIVYGQDPGSAVAKGMTKRLMRLRYNKVRMFAGGMKAWTDAGMPVEAGQGR